MKNNIHNNNNSINNNTINILNINDIANIKKSINNIKN